MDGSIIQKNFQHKINKKETFECSLFTIKIPIDNIKVIDAS